MGYWIAASMIFGLYGSIMGVVNWRIMKKSGKITETGVISPEGKDIVKKENR